MNTREEYHILKGNKTYGKEDCPFCNVLESKKEHILWTGKYIRNMLMNQGFPVVQHLD